MIQRRIIRVEEIKEALSKIKTLNKYKRIYERSVSIIKHVFRHLTSLILFVLRLYNKSIFSRIY